MEESSFIMSTPTGDIIPSVEGTPAPRLVPGKMGTALRLEGAKLNYGTPAPECFSSPDLCNNGLSVSLWVKFFVINVDSMVFVFGGIFAGERGVFMNRLRFGWFSIGLYDDNKMIFGKVYKGGNVHHWQHIVITWEGNSSPFAVYLNGCPATVDTRMINQQPFRSPSDFRIGGGDDPGESIAYITLDHMLMWHDFLTPQEVWQLYVQGGQVWWTLIHIYMMRFLAISKQMLGITYLYYFKESDI